MVSINAETIQIKHGESLSIEPQGFHDGFLLVRMEEGEIRISGLSTPNWRAFVVDHEGWHELIGNDVDRQLGLTLPLDLSIQMGEIERLLGLLHADAVERCAVAAELFGVSHIAAVLGVLEMARRQKRYPREVTAAT
jgi:hypothetical protein